MKKTLVALSVAALAATSANAATVYNQDGTKVDINGSVRVMLNKLTDHRADLQNDGSRVKVKFSQEIGEGLKALGYIEVRPSDDDFGGGITTKRLYAGLAADGIGNIVFGKAKTAADHFKLADPTEQGYSIKDATDYKTAGDKVVKFETANFAGFGFETSYAFDKTSDKYEATGSETKNKNAYQFLAKYDNDFDGLGVNARALYSHAKNNTADANKTWGLAAGVSYAGFGFAADYAHAKQGDQKAKGYSFATTYQVAEPVDVYAVYTHGNFDNTEREVVGNATKVAVDKVKAITLGSHYQVAKNVMTYVEYASVKHTSPVKDAEKRDNKYYAGLRVFF